MRRFRFSLASVERLREREEHNAMMAHAVKLREHEALIHEQSVLTQARLTALGDLAKTHRVDEMRRLDAHVTFVQAQRMAIGQRIAVSTQIVAQSQQELVQAMQAHKALTLLHERRADEYRREMQRVEQLEIDEIATTRSARRAASPEMMTS